MSTKVLPIPPPTSCRAHQNFKNKEGDEENEGGGVRTGVKMGVRVGVKVRTGMEMGTDNLNFVDIFFVPP